MQWLLTEPVETIVNKMLLPLKNNSQSLKLEYNEDTRNKIRRFSQFVKSQPVERQELFWSIRAEVHAGSTGPYLNEHTPISKVPFETRQKLTESLFCK